jgi:hypothetical protein
VLFYHDGSVLKALLALFPDIGLDKSKFKSHKRKGIVSFHGTTYMLFLSRDMA